MNILDKIVAQKKIEVKERKNTVSLAQLEASDNFKRTAISLRDSLTKTNSSGIIAEHKRKSPSLGWIKEGSDVVEITNGYEKAGAAALSILTDELFFGGAPKDVINARKNVKIPILRKDFMIDPYQIAEAKVMGADVILLIAECLTKAKVKSLAQTAKDMGLEILLEMHDATQLEKICDAVTCVGVNNRNLKTFDVSIQTSIDLSSQIPDKFVKVAESGITNPRTIQELITYGFQGFLIGEAFMKTPNPGEALSKFIN